MWGWFFNVAGTTDQLVVLLLEPAEALLLFELAPHELIIRGQSLHQHLLRDAAGFATTSILVWERWQWAPILCPLAALVSLCCPMPLLCHLMPLHILGTISSHLPLMMFTTHFLVSVS